MKPTSVGEGASSTELMNLATAPATCEAAIEVPLMGSSLPSRCVDVTSVPGAKIFKQDP